MPDTNAPEYGFVEEIKKLLKDLFAGIKKFISPDRVITLAGVFDHFNGKPELQKFFKDPEKYFLGALWIDKTDKGEEVVAAIVYDISTKRLLPDYSILFIGDKLDQPAESAFGNKRLIRFEKTPADAASRAASSANYNVMSLD